MRDVDKAFWRFAALMITAAAITTPATGALSLVAVGVALPLLWYFTKRLP